MRYGLNIKSEGALDLVSLGALVHRLDPGIFAGNGFSTKHKPPL